MRNLIRRFVKILRTRRNRKIGADAAEVFVRWPSMWWSLEFYDFLHVWILKNIIRYMFPVHFLLSHFLFLFSRFPQLMAKMRRHTSLPENPNRAQPAAMTRERNCFQEVMSPFTFVFVPSKFNTMAQCQSMTAVNSRRNEKVRSFLHFGLNIQKIERERESER